VVATALLDRLLHNTIVMPIEGNSYRLREHAALLPGHMRNLPITPEALTARQDRAVEHVEHVEHGEQRRGAVANIAVGGNGVVERWTGHKPHGRGFTTIPSLALPTAIIPPARTSPIITQTALPSFSPKGCPL
jgi:hypothetical protein